MPTSAPVRCSRARDWDRIPAYQNAIRHISGPLRVHGRNSDNRLIEEKLG